LKLQECTLTDEGVLVNNARLYIDKIETLTDFRNEGLEMTKAAAVVVSQLIAFFLSTNKLSLVTFGRCTIPVFIRAIQAHHLAWSSLCK